jgi:phospholipase/carboxylesterase
MHQVYRTEICGLETLVVEAEQPCVDVVLMHGYAMEPEDLAPFAKSLGVPARFLFPRGSLEAAEKGRCWWPIDFVERTRKMALGSRDLADEHPPGREHARRQMNAFLETANVPMRPSVLGGFSQGGMLACEALFLDQARPDALVLLSSSRVAIDEWEPHLSKASGLPVFVAHGRQDQDLAFSAGQALFASLERVTPHAVWCPFEGGHEIPLPVWRALRKFLRQFVGDVAPDRS